MDIDRRVKRLEADNQTLDTWHSHTYFKRTSVLLGVGLILPADHDRCTSTHLVQKEEAEEEKRAGQSRSTLDARLGVLLIIMTGHNMNE